MKQKRLYQQHAEDAIFAALQRGRKKQLIVLPGGTGKTFICVNVINRFDNRKLWITHEESLGEQSAISILQEFFDPWSEYHQVIDQTGGLNELIKSKNLTNSIALEIQNRIGLVKAEQFDISKEITIASAQTLWRRLDQIPPDWFEVIVVDEGDLFGSKTFKAPLDYFTPKLLLGATATPYRSDGMLMEDIFEEITFEYKIQDAIKDGYLTELNAIVVKTSTNLDDVHTSMGDFNQKELTEKVNTLERNNLIVNKYIEYCSGQQFICFGADVQHVIDLHEAFQQKGIKTAYVVSDKDRMEIGTDRKQIVKDYREGQIIGLINHNIFSAGFNHDDCGAVLLACPTKSKRKFLQQLFRVTRLKTPDFVSKFGQIGTILDIVDGTSKHSLINTRELDKGLEIEDRIFVSKKNKELLIEAKNERKFRTTYRKEDKKVDLLKIPKVKISDSFRMSEPATPAQLAVIARWEYDVENTTYTKKMISEIFNNQRCSDASFEALKQKGYDVEGKFISVAQAKMAFTDFENKKSKMKPYRK